MNFSLAILLLFFIFGAAVTLVTFSADQLKQPSFSLLSDPYWQRRWIR